MDDKNLRVKARTERIGLIERKTPLGWNTMVESDDKTVKVIFKYWARYKTENERHPKEYYMDYSFPKQDIVAMIPEEGYHNSYSLINHAKRLKYMHEMKRQYISRILSNDFEKIQERTKSTSEMYAELLNRFANELRYQKPIRSLARYEAILWLLKRPKAFHSGDIRDRM